MALAECRYVNPRTDVEWPVNKPIWRAPDDGGYVNLTLGEGLRRGDIDASSGTLWRYRRALRLPRDDFETMGEGWTPLIPSVWGECSVLMKCEHMMPTGSFKDRGTAVLFNYLKQSGISEILEDSSGNAGASYAAYAAAFRLLARILVPASAPDAKKTQIAAMGACMEAIEGTRQDVAEAALSASKETFYASHNWQPYFIEGTKTLAFEIWEQSGFSLPDNVIVPLGYGSNVVGLHLGFKELMKSGEIDRMPRIFGAQAKNCAALYAAWNAGGKAVRFEMGATIADGIASEKPVRVAEVMAALQETGGGVEVASEAEIAEAFELFAHRGFFVEPTTATAGAVLKNLLHIGKIDKSELSIVVLTGHGLKAMDKIENLAGN
tara:strand:- start:1396 stop:2532 length:1137 start_codon:yes stop_codon:yes gene_type:complete